MRREGFYPEMQNSPSATEEFLDESWLESPPSTAKCDFERAKLRQFPRRGLENEWTNFLGFGEEALVLEATIGGGKPVAVDVVRISLLFKT